MRREFQRVGEQIQEHLAQPRGISNDPARHVGGRLEIQRDALCALYAFMRGTDDISDEPGELSAKQHGLAALRAEMDRALAGDVSGSPVWPAFRDTVERFQIPRRYLHDLISGAEMDLTVNVYETFDRLREYCYRVAGTVGLCCVHVFGFSDPRAPELAERLISPFGGGEAWMAVELVRGALTGVEGRVEYPPPFLAFE